MYKTGMVEGLANAIVDPVCDPIVDPITGLPPQDVPVTKPDTSADVCTSCWQ
jgi:hypothetical protein